MYNFWIIVLCLVVLETMPITGHSDVDVKLVVPRYVERGASATFKCIHNVPDSILYKVAWLKVDSGKFFEFIRNRSSPYKNHTIDGGEIDWDNTNGTQVTLMDVSFDLSGQFYCEVSTDLPIFTKASGDEIMSVYLPQRGPPIIKFKKRSPFMIGEKLFAICNTTRARPAPTITWLINGKRVEEKYVRTHHVYAISGKKQNKGGGHQAQQLNVHPEQVQQPYYQPYYTPYHIPHFMDRYDKSLRYGGSRAVDDFALFAHPGHDGHGHHANIFNNPFSSLANYHDISEGHEIKRNYDNKKHMEIKKKVQLRKHRNPANRKFRRHVNENALGILRSHLQSGGFGPQPPNINKELGIPYNAGPMNTLAAGYTRPISHQGGGSGVAAAAAAVTAAQYEKGLFSISQLNIDLGEQHVGANGRMEITCLSTIPATVGQGEQFADFKTYSVKVEVEYPEGSSSTSTASPRIGMAALGNGHGNETSAGWRARGFCATHVRTLAQLLLLLFLMTFWY